MKTWQFTKLGMAHFRSIPESQRKEIGQKIDKRFRKGYTYVNSKMLQEIIESK